MADENKVGETSRARSQTELSEAKSTESHIKSPEVRHKSKAKEAKTHDVLKLWQGTIEIVIRSSIVVSVSYLS